MYAFTQPVIFLYDDSVHKADLLYNVYFGDVFWRDKNLHLCGVLYLVKRVYFTYHLITFPEFQSLQVLETTF